MITSISNNDVDKLEEKYPQLKEFERKYILYSNDMWSFLPRYFPEQFPFSKYKIFNSPSYKEVELNNIKFTKTLRDYQEEGANHIIDTYNNSKSVYGIFEARPGYGKTTVTAYWTCVLKKKTLIILNNSKLMEQWINSYLKFTNLTEKDIGIIKSKKLELDKPVAIAMVQTLMSKVKNDLVGFYKKFHDAGYGLVVYDEVHRTSSGQKYATSSLLLPTKNIIGLSATPFPRDLNAILLYNSIGHGIYRYKGYEIVPKHIFFVNYTSNITKKQKKQIAFFYNYIQQVAFYNSIIYKDPVYLTLLGKLARKCYETGHYTLIMASTINQVEHIINQLQSMGLPATPVYSKINNVNFEKDKLLVGTIKYVSEGFDDDYLSALIYATPLKGKTSLIQTIGRIVRDRPGKLQPVIIDLMDSNAPAIFHNSKHIKEKIIMGEFEVPLDAFKTINYVEPPTPTNY